MPVEVGFGVIFGIFPAPKGQLENKGGAGHDDVGNAGACVGMAGKGTLVLVLPGLLTSASEGGTKDVDADVSMGEDSSGDRGDVGRAVESGWGNAIEEGLEAISSNLAATRSEMHN